MRGDGLQMGCRPSKAGDNAAASYMRSETGSGYIRQANAALAEGDGFFRAFPHLYNTVDIYKKRMDFKPWERQTNKLPKAKAKKNGKNTF